MVLVVLTCGSLLASLLADTLLYSRSTKKFEKQVIEETYSALGLLVGRGLYKHFKNTVSLSMTILGDLPRMGKRMRCGLLLDKLYTLLVHKRKGAMSKRQLLLAIYRVLWVDVMWLFIVTFGTYACLLARVPILE